MQFLILPDLLNQVWVRFHYADDIQIINHGLHHLLIISLLLPRSTSLIYSSFLSSLFLGLAIDLIWVPFVPRWVERIDLIPFLLFAFHEGSMWCGLVVWLVLWADFQIRIGDLRFNCLDRGFWIQFSVFHQWINRYPPLVILVFLLFSIIHG